MKLQWMVVKAETENLQEIEMDAWDMLSQMSDSQLVAWLCNVVC